MGFGQTNIDGAAQLGQVATLGDVFNLFINLLFGIGIALGILFVIIGGIKFITSSGDEGKFSEAKDTVFYSIIGIIVIISFRQIIDFALHILGSGNLDSYLTEQAGCSLNLAFGAETAKDPSKALSQIGCSLNILIVALRHVVMALGLVFSIVAGIKYSTASGNPDKLAEAQKTLTWAVAASVLAVFFWTILVLIAKIFGIEGIEGNGFNLVWDFSWIIK